MKEKKAPNKFKKSFMLTKASWNTLMLDKELLALPVIGMAMSLIILAMAGAVIYVNPMGVLFNAPDAYNAAEIIGGYSIKPLGYLGIVVIGLCISIISTFVSASVIYGALQRFKGNDPTIKSCLLASKQRAGSLAIFSLFSYTIGLIISEIANRIPYVGDTVVSWLAGAAWGIASFFAIPTIIGSDKPVGPIAATKSSFAIMRKIWGESLVSTVAIGIIEMIAVLVYVIAAINITVLVATLPSSSYILAPLIAAAIFGLFVIFLTFSVLEALLKAALFHYATTGESPVTFNQQLLRQAFTQKKARKVFNN